MNNNTANVARYKEKLKSNGLCITCCTKPVKPGQSRCPICAAKNRIYNRDRYYNKIEMRRCVTCGEKAAPRRCQCQKCIDYSAIKRRMVRAERARNGMCVLCNKPNKEPQYGTCPACRKKQREYNKKRKRQRRAIFTKGARP